MQTGCRNLGCRRQAVLDGRTFAQRGEHHNGVRAVSGSWSDRPGRDAEHLFEVVGELVLPHIAHGQCDVFDGSVRQGRVCQAASALLKAELFDQRHRGSTRVVEYLVQGAWTEVGAPGDLARSQGGLAELMMDNGGDPGMLDPPV